MPKISIYKSELYPVYFFDKTEEESGSVIIDVDEETLEHWQRIVDAFGSLNRDIGKIYGPLEKTRWAELTKAATEIA